jgi:formylglycine-generating enzyme required for sulfatase activity
MRELEVRLVDGHNNALADLFDPDHARKVLAAFGRALGRLPEKTPTAEQHEFLDQAIRGLAEEGKVVCVRLALFAEMMKGKPWTPASLKAVGGTEGVGVAFLEETFSAAGAPPEHRYHQKAARAVLKALLPEAGTDIKGHMRSEAELLAASGYAVRPGDFEDLIRILDREVRLLTPTDPEGVEQGAGAPRSPTERYYQLTHDYLVPALRDWLTRKQRETRRGRAELRLAERAALWNSKPEDRHLPAWWEWANLRLYTRKRDWTPPQRRMMRRAGRYHAFRGTLLALGLALLALGGWWTHGALRARALVDTLVAAKTADVPELIHDLGPYRRWADRLLREKAAQEGLDEDKRLHVALALLPVDAGQADYLCDRLLTARGPKEVKAIRAVLHEQARGSATRFWPVLESEGEGKARRLRAACALALFDADDVRWTKLGDAVARSLAGESVALLAEWAGLLQPVRGHLAQPLVRRPVEADAGGFQAFLAVLSAYPEEAAAALHGQLRLTLPPTARQEDKEALAQQQARAGVALLHLGRTERVWPLFHQGEDPTRRTYLVHRCAEWGVDAGILANRLLGEEEKDPSIRQGLLLALGEYKADQRAEVAGGPLVDRVLGDYRDHPDPGVHSSAEWLLRQWRLARRLSRADRELLEACPRRRPGEIAKPRWEVNGQGQAFAVIPAPGTFQIGSPPEEKGRFGAEEDRRRVRIDYPFAVATKLVTVAEYKKFRPGFAYMKRYCAGEDTPINGVNWYDAAAYCNWLSEAEGIPTDQWCYPPVAEIERAEKEKSPLKLPANFAQRTGYRLPREAEWEYACRAGTVTAWSHGSDEAMLRHYAWYSLNSDTMIHPAGTRKPNGLGLFDAHGNAWQWCQDDIGVSDHVDKQDVNDKVFRVLRCGSFRDGANYARSACRGGLVPTRRDYFIVFRVARTYR